MTSVAAVRISGAGVPRRRSAEPQTGRSFAPSALKLAGQWNEPMPWIFVLGFVLFAILAFHNQIARAIGTAAPVQGTATTVSAPAAPPVDLAATGTPATAEVAAPLPNRAPRDPFQALVSPAGARVPVVTLTIPKSHSGRQTHGGTSTGPTGTTTGSTGRSASCAATHVVRSGDSLWSIAQQQVDATGHGSVAPYWHQIYQANRSVIGANPSQLSVGLHLCLPTT